VDAAATPECLRSMAAIKGVLNVRAL
jgi:hypothetical protein